MSSAEAWFERLPEQITPIDSVSLTVSVIALSVLFTAPNRPAQIFGTIMLAMLGALILLVPSYTMVLFVISCGLIGLVRSRNGTRDLHIQLDKLSRVVHELQLAENHHLIQLLNSPSLPMSRQRGAPSISPSEQTEDAAESSKIHVVRSLPT
jgi:hypothetical protein